MARPASVRAAAIPTFETSPHVWPGMRRMMNPAAAQPDGAWRSTQAVAVSCRPASQRPAEWDHQRVRRMSTEPRVRAHSPQAAMPWALSVRPAARRAILLFTAAATAVHYTLSLHDALPI